MERSPAASRNHMRVVTCHIRVATCHIRVATCHIRVVTCHIRVATCHMRGGGARLHGIGLQQRLEARRQLRVRLGRRRALAAETAQHDLEDLFERLCLGVGGWRRARRRQYPALLIGEGLGAGGVWRGEAAPPNG
eukprot:7377807-Prymnesium_polylepis.1